MLRKVAPWQHGLAGLAVVGAVGLTGAGVVGAGDQALLRPEHFDAKQVTVAPDGSGGVRIREVVDIDFGLTERRGYQRIIPNDFGRPTDVVASSPDADDTVDILVTGALGESSELSGDTRIRIGDPNVTFTGQRRYVLEYTLPLALDRTRTASGGDVLALDIIGNDETFTTDDFDVVVTGMEFGSTSCDVGAFGAFGGCELSVRDDGTYRADIGELEPGEGITIGGAITAFAEPAVVPIPALPERNPDGPRPLGLVMAPVALAAAGGVYVASRRYGSNVVVSGGAADAAFGELPTPGDGEPVADVPTHRVPDSRLADLATIEFVPPRGVEPWQGAALLTERVDDDTVSAWFAEMVAREAIEVSGDDDDLELRRGTGNRRLNAIDQGHLDRLFASSDRVRLGTYDKKFTSTWSRIRDEQARFIRDSGWWLRGGPGGGSSIKLRSALPALIVPLLFLFVVGSVAVRSFGALLSTPVLAVIGLGLAVAVVAFATYRSMLASRSATGSALTLRTESFRRFLVASEGRHVEWAWERNLLREYSAWAVALGAADAWRKAVESSNIPHPEVALGGPLIIYTSGGSFRSARTPPSSSGGGGGGFGGGGGVGGGGGGGSSGSW